MAGYTLRVATPADADAIAEAYAPLVARPVEPLRERLRQVFAGTPQPASLLAVGSDGRLAAHFGALRQHFRSEEKSFCFGRIFASFVHPDYRIGGRHSPFMELQAAFRERFEGPDDLGLVYGRWPEIDHWFLRALCDFDSLSTPWLCERLPDRPLPETGLATRALSASDLEGWEDLAFGAALRRVRDRGWLEEQLAVPQRRVLVAEDGGRLLALAVDEEREAERRLLDLAVEDGHGEAGRAILRAVSKGCAQPVRGWIWNPPRFIAYILQDAGFRVRCDEEPYLSARWAQRGLKQSRLHAEWQVMEADFGGFSQPAFGVGEAIVTPPMAGTEARKPRGLKS